MTLTLERTATATDWLHSILDPLRDALSRAEDPAGRADAAVDVLRRRLPSADLLTDQQRQGSSGGYQQHVLHVEPRGAFSIVALVWQPGQFTTIHDHVCWCAVGVLAGVEHETLYGRRLLRGRYNLIERSQRDSVAGDVSGFAPPGDIHRVRNTGTEIAISLHVYGADIATRGTSVRHNYAA